MIAPHNIIEMQQDSYHILARSKSKFVRIWDTNNVLEKEPIDNLEIVTSMTFSYKCLITCDINYEIRYDK